MTEYDNFNIFPRMDWPLWAAIGISLGTTAISSPITDRNLPGLTTATVSSETVLVDKTSPSQAGLADFVYGETEDSRNVVGPTRVQHVGLTAVLAASYLVSLWQFAQQTGGIEIVRSAKKNIPVFASMPPISQSFLALLVATHGTLLAGKFYDNKKTS